jgi:hypothetical protein
MILFTSISKVKKKILNTTKQQSDTSTELEMPSGLTQLKVNIVRSLKIDHETLAAV